MSSYQINTDISDSPHESFRPSICPPLTARVISALKQPLPWTVWTAVTGEEVRTGAWKTLPARPGSLMSFSPSYDNHRMRSGFIIFFLVAAISSIRFLRALSGPAKVRRHMYRCTCKKKKKKKNESRANVPVFANPRLWHCSTSRATQGNSEPYTCVSEPSRPPPHMHKQWGPPWKEDWDLRRPNRVWQSTALLKQAPLQPNTAVIVNVRQN